ncbi:rhodanese-related sulfurtransferase [Candidatus Saccharibacteria bacterium]|nr:rhodanese-related sulfurtransferase [Candidatus Saccharibacteria bacterium]MCB9817502.1 rhodanese-related sulfurtransferase [Candidatus Nomurabacteria bacterium]HPD98912.1 rhodanese-related sulfurtransferase [Candidatus Saccharibacteria bacterium]
MEKVILYYKFVPVADPETTKLWQRELCERYGLKGRIIISTHGINGTLGGPIDGLKAYVKAMNVSIFKKTVYKWSEGSADDFPRLSIKVRPELVAFGAPDAVKVDNSGVIGGGKHLKPEEVNALVAERGDDVIFFDGRNAYEAQIGKFKNTVVPNVRYTRDFLKELDDPKYNDIKDKPIVSYCTGGIRCELLSVHMKNKGFKEVYQIDGGIVKYGETYKDDGLWEGKLYVFDNRMVTGFSKDAKDIGECVHCQGKTSNFENCANVACNDLILICKDCHTTTQTCAKSSCKQTVATKA